MMSLCLHFCVTTDAYLMFDEFKLVFTIIICACIVILALNKIICFTGGNKMGKREAKRDILDTENILHNK